MIPAQQVDGRPGFERSRPFVQYGGVVLDVVGEGVTASGVLRVGAYLEGIDSVT